MASVRVAVRVRPFNSREKKRNAKCCIKMEEKSTWITNPEDDKEKMFTFDFSYQSHSGFYTDDTGYNLAEKGTNYASQMDVYNDLGADILKNAWEGYNVSLFAYGQTGAGKSYSMVGYGVNKGIIPITCDEMFKRIEQNDDPKIHYLVTVSMLEIYNEQVRDLFNPKGNPKGGLKVRSKPGVGVYVDKLTGLPVASYKEIEAAMERGTQNRTIASTQMNATSSRAHTVFSIKFQIMEGPKKEKLASKINLVDLAGSERADSTGATGDRLKEGCAINQSLSALGNVISALADKSSGKKGVFIPYRNSVLTRLLQDALGGNSKTIMIAALSPADINYEETLSTLRYADRAKRIKNAVKKNENPTDKMIRELKAENARLMELLKSQGVDTSKPQDEQKKDNDALEKLKAQLTATMEENKRLMDDMSKSWDEKRQETAGLVTGGPQGAAMGAAATSAPHIVNLHEDPQLSECVMYVFKPGLTKIGRANADEKQDIELSGLNLKKQHAVVENKDNSVVITPVDKSKTFVNGELITGPTELKMGDRLILGNNFVFRFQDPSVDMDDLMDWNAAMDEFNKKGREKLAQALGDSSKKLDEEDAKKRQELEERLKQMEEEVRKAKEAAAQDLAEQARMYELKMNSGSLSTTEQKEMEDFKKKQEETMNTLDADLEQKKAMSKQILQDQLKRKRQTKKVEQTLVALMPMVKEANDMAIELNKPVRFEPHLVVKSAKHVNLDPMDELQNPKQIEVQVQVKSEEDGSIWNWSYEKFENRLYIMRDFYAEMSQDPNAVGLSNDPFWDPPDPIVIGNAWVYLKALSQLVEIDNSFDIVDYKGNTQGSLKVGIFPQDRNGNEMEYLDSNTQLLGKDVHFKVVVNGATGLPDKYSNEVRVSYQFFEQPQAFAVHKGRTTAPQWNLTDQYFIENIDDQFLQYLLSRPVVFEVRGFTDAQMKSIPDDIEPEFGNELLCDQCEETAAVLECVDCNRVFCDNCFGLLHKSARKHNHETHPIGGPVDAMPAPPGGASGGPLCSQCEENPATLSCTDCDRDFCDDCNAVLHKSKKKKTHNRIPLGNVSPAGAPADAATPTGSVVCDQCEEAQAEWNCTDCDRQLCGDCFGVLHKAKRKRDHNKVPI